MESTQEITQETIPQPVPKRGRPRKYATEEEAKAARLAHIKQWRETHREEIRAKAAAKRAQKKAQKFALLTNQEVDPKINSLKLLLNDLHQKQTMGLPVSISYVIQVLESVVEDSE